MAKAAPRKARTVTDRIERSVKRAAQKAAGVFDGRFRPRVVKSCKTYKRKPKHPDSDS